LDLFRSENYKTDTDFSDVRLTVDEPEDLEVVKLVIEKLGLDKDWRTYADFYILNKEINELNGSSKRNEGYDKSLKED
jgi:spore coat polysaccharide biosynthesis protein SpsF